jgi:hypothetical protein
MISAQPVLCRDRDVCVDSVRHLLFSSLHLYRSCLDSFPPSIFRIQYPTRLPISIRVKLADTYSFGDDRQSMGLARDRGISFLAMGTLVRLPISYPRLFPSLKSLDQPIRYILHSFLSTHAQTTDETMRTPQLTCPGGLSNEYADIVRRLLVLVRPRYAPFPTFYPPIAPVVSAQHLIQFYPPIVFICLAFLTLME